MAGAARPALRKLPTMRYRRAKTMHVPLCMPSLCTVISPISATA
jgi:hypothetical protein